MLLTVLTVALLVMMAVGLGIQAFGHWATRKHRRLSVAMLPCGALPPISLLKPLKGDEEQLEANLRTFFEQDYPGGFEVVLAATEPDDPGLAAARSVARDYPDVPVRVVISDAGFGLNPKVANLAGALRAASHDLVLQSDANVRVAPGYLRAVASEMEATGASLLTSPVVGTGERSIGAAMENLQLSAFIAPAMCTALHLAGIHCVVGKSMLFRRSELAAMGGLELVRDILAEDFILGERYHQAGKTVVLSASLIENVNEQIPVERFVARHSRWLKMRAVIHLGGFFADLAANPIALAAAVVLTSGFSTWSIALLAALVPIKVVADALYVRRLRGHPMKLGHLALAPVKDLVMGAVWVHSIFSRSICWRGVKLRLGARSLLRPDDGALPIRVFRRVLGLAPATQQR